MIKGKEETMTHEEMQLNWQDKSSKWEKRRDEKEVKGTEEEQGERKEIG